MRRAFGNFTLALSCAACGEQDPGSPLEIEVRDAASDVPSEYRVVLARDDGDVFGVTCPSRSPEGPLSCGARGVTVERSGLPAELTFKVRGHTFQSVRFSAESNSNAGTNVALERLPEFTKVSNYATGFLPDEESVAFDELAFSAPSELGETRSLKFYIEDLDDEPRVYFQNTKRFPRHIDFVQMGLGRPISAPQFEASIRGPERSAMVGTLISRPKLSVASSAARGELIAPITLEFFPSDDLSPEQALVAHQLLEQRLGFVPLDGAERRLTYVPASARAEAELVVQGDRFRAREAGVARIAELYAGISEQILNPGLSYGTLRLFSPEELEHTVVSRHDILVLTRLPNDLPLVAGTITEELQTPLAHVNLAARARGTPNIALASASTDQRVAPLLDGLVRFEVSADGFTLEATSLEEAEEFWASQVREPLVPASDDEFSALLSFDELGFEDAIRVGVKAANIAELHQLLGEGAPKGFGVPFSVFDAFMRGNTLDAPACEAANADCAAGGRSAAACEQSTRFCAAGAEASDDFYAYLERLLDDERFRADTATREASLAGFRFLLENGVVNPDFAAELDARVAELFGADLVRLRSSTNVEDLAEFSGAGLYDSVTAEADGDRRASDRIRRVWASTYTFAAFEERALWNVTESAVRMGVAVNQAFGDELANGVLVTRNIAAPNSPGYYVNVQVGELPVANPENGAVPEILTLVPAGEGFETVRQRFSSMSPDAPILSDEEAQTLARAASLVQAHFAPLYATSVQSLALDLEFKFVAPDRALVIKQARPYFSASP